MFVFVVFMLLGAGMVIPSYGVTQRPNIVFILADDLGWNDVSFHGSDQIPTPNLDALAYDGILLKNYYVQAICTPTRGALMTARYPIHTGLQHSVIVSSAPYGLGLNETILPQYLKELNYSTHIVGKCASYQGCNNYIFFKYSGSCFIMYNGFFAEEYTPLWRGFDSHYGYYMGEEDYWAHTSGSPTSWHLGFHAEEYTPIYRGFDSHYGYYQGCEDYYDHTYTNNANGDPKQWGLDWRRNMEVVNTDFGRYSTELFSNEAENIIENHNKDKPLFLYLPHQAVHSGNPMTKQVLEAPWKYQEKFQFIKHPGRRMFAAMVSALDDAVGNVTEALQRRDMLSNTIIIFSTDNGGPAAGFDENFANNWPLRGLKSTLWEGGTRATGFIWSPLLQKSGYHSEHMLHVVDWLPTLLSAAGYDMTKLPRDLDGINQWDTLSKDGDPVRTELLYNIDPKQPSWAVRVHNMKLIYGRGSTGSFDGWYSPELLANKVNMSSTVDKSNDPDYYMSQYNSLAVDTEKARHLDVETHTEKAPSHMFSSRITQILRDIGRDIPNVSPLVVKCPYRPANYSTNCKPSTKPCLFDIANDPCEFNNLADLLPEVVNRLLNRVYDYERSAVQPRNKRPDPEGYPYYHNGVWVPWIKL